jgi:hypothetical protein
MQTCGAYTNACHPGDAHPEPPADPGSDDDSGGGGSTTPSNGSGTASSSNGSSTKSHNDCHWYNSCGLSNAWNSTKKWAREHREAISVVTEVVVGGACAITAVGAGLASGGAGLAAAAGCGAIAGAAGSAVNNALDPEADHSVAGQLSDQANGAIWGAATSVVGDGAGKVIAKAAPKVIAKVAQILGKCHSFLPGTKVLMADGKKKDIEDVEAGDTVVTTDVETGKNVEKKVLDTIRTEDDKDFTEITVATGDTLSSIVATDTHPFWVPDLKEWVPAGDLETGQWLRTSAGVKVQITALHHYTERQRTHDLTIDGIHAYYVLADKTPLLVHNCGGSLLSRARALFRTRADTQTTVAVARVRSVNNAENVETWVATERAGLPNEWRGGNAPLRGERYIFGQGHAEATIMNQLGTDWEMLGMASSTRMCTECLEQAQGLGLKPSNIGKGTGVSSTGNTPWRVVLGDSD